MLICATCQSIVLEGRCTNAKCGTGNHVRWTKPRTKITPEKRHQQHEQMKIAKQIDLSCRFLTLEVLNDSYIKTECSECGEVWEWMDPLEVKYCPACGAKVQHDRRGGEIDG